MSYRLGNPYTVVLLITALFTFGLAAVSLRHGDRRASKPLAGFLGAIGLWALGDAVRIAAPTASAVLFWNQVAYAGIVFVPPTLLLFALSYTGHTRWVRRRYVVALLSVSVLVLAVIVTNQAHSLWLEVESITPGTPPPVLSETWGPVWYPWATYVYAVVLLVTTLLASEFLTARRPASLRRQTGLVLAGILFGSVTNILFILGVFSFDPTPFAFAVTGTTFAVAITRYELLTLLPVARDTVFRNMDSGVLVFDSGGRIVDANQQARSMFALGPERAEWTSADARVEVGRGPEELEEIREWLDAPTGTETITVEVEGETRHYAIDRSEISDATGTYAGHVVVLNDVTAQVAARERLEGRTADLERKNEQLDEFASVVSHDLRNPLNVIDGRVALARDADEPDPHLDAIANAAARMDALTDDLLTLARQGDAIDETEPVSIRDVATAAWDVVRTDGASLTVETGGTVLADRDRLQEAFENLFRNAVEHSSASDQRDADSDGVTVTVGGLEGGFFVADDGPGVPEGERERVFESGYSTATEGTGLGLAIVERVVEAHGWELCLNESETGGARFEVTGVSTVT